MLAVARPSERGGVRGQPARSRAGGAPAQEALVVRYAAQMTLDGRWTTPFDRPPSTSAPPRSWSADQRRAAYNMVARFLVALGVTPEH